MKRALSSSTCNLYNCGIGVIIVNLKDNLTGMSLMNCQCCVSVCVCANTSHQQLMVFQKHVLVPSTTLDAAAVAADSKIEKMNKKFNF